MRYFQMNFRNSCSKGCLNPQFIGVMCFIILNYVGFVYFFMLDYNPPCERTYCRPDCHIVLLVIFHVFFLMMLWSYIRVIISDPGRVPIYWGFFLDERESRRRRYCLLCHSFKPERCHHCSTCQRCVLNMDHHCPWISNCIGFMNRKFFLLFLFYVVLTVVFTIAAAVYPMFKELSMVFGDFSTFTAFTAIRAAVFLILIIFLAIIAHFLKFHVELVLNNSTTIDNLERQRNPSASSSNVYDMGSSTNFRMFFGNNPLLWPFPLFGESGKPSGDGVQWSRNKEEDPS